MNLLVLIVTVLVTELRCFYSKPVYINHDEKFRNIAVTSDFVYIGGNSKIIKLDSSLIQLDHKYVSMEEDGHSKLGKMCTGDANSRSNSFEDTPIICSHDGKNYTLAYDAVHWKDYLFVAFSNDSLNVICKYKIQNIAEKFMKSRQKRLECPYTTENTYFEKQTLADWCFNETSKLCQRDLNNMNNHSCPELTDVDDGFCNTIFFGSVEGTLPLTEVEIIYSEETGKVGTIVKLGILSYFTHSVIFAGTTTGKIGKIYVDDRRSKQFGTFNIVQHSFPVLDIKVQNQNVYVMTENTVIDIADIEPCPADVLCLECMTSDNPACGWDILSASCRVNTDNSTWWLPSLGRECLKVNAKELVIGETTDNKHTENISVHLLFDPDIYFNNAICRNKLSDGQIMNLKGYNECVLTVGDEPFQLNVILSKVIIASTTVNAIKCSAFNSCGACANISECFWCLETVSCVRQASTCTTAVNISMTEDICPRLTSTKVLIQATETENLEINVVNLVRYVNSKDKLQCVVGNVKYDVVVDDSYTFAVCKNVKAPKSNNTKLYLEYNGSILDNDADLEVYRCNDVDSSCGVCKYHKTQGYKCDWCGSCKPTISGAPDRCTEDELVQCQLSLSGVYPSAGPEFGGTMVNINGTNIGNRGDNISVTINGVKCENVTVIKPSTVISCITNHASASTHDGIEVTVNGVISLLTRLKYTFRSQLELLTFSPSKGILSGGRKISIQGTNIGFIGSRYKILFCYGIKCIQCRFLQIEDDHTLTCNMEGSESFITLTYLTVTIDGNTHLRLNSEFMIVADPLVVPLSVDSSTVFRSGGQKLTITGTGFSNVGVVIVDTPDAVPCTIISDSIVVCESPPFVKSDFERRKRSAVQNIYVNFDSYRVSLGVFYVDDPLFEKLSKVFVYISNAVIEIKGSGLLQGARADDYFIRVGLDGLCLITDINNDNITCLPPKTKPRTNTGDLVFIVVIVGNIKEPVGYLRYESSTIRNSNIVLYGVAGGVIIGVLVIISFVVIMMRRSMKRKIDKTKTEMKEMKEEIRKVVVKADELSAGMANSRMQCDEPYDEVYDEINSEEESYSKTHRNTYLDVTSGYEDLGQMTATNPYNVLQQAEASNTDYLTNTQLSSNDLSQSEDYMEPVDTTN
ncbi:plexin-A4-like [Mytilus edulis]|uniref:plexin-A4-like n=1 Tax=Mytilus edulis TaxID=6550 RepID=UPI0039F06F51